jgi:glycine hydroxymethyltransferase
MSGAWFQAKAYGLDPETGLLNMDSVRKIALEWKPKLIIAGYSAYPRKLDFAQFRSIADEVGAQLLVDMAHFAGLVAAGYHDNPFPHAHYVTSTTHKTLRGPRGGIILTNSEDLAKKMNSRIFPGLQGGPLEHVIAGKAVAFGEALKPEFKIYIKNVIENSQAIAERLKKNNLNLVTDGTDNHLVLIDLSQLPVSGKEAEAALGRAGITVNKNTVPNEKRSPFVTSGIRIGTPALTSRGMGKSEMMLIGDWISQIILSPADEIMQNKIRISVQEMTAKFPIYS